MKSILKTYIVDSFTDKPFTGNPAGVCLVDHDLSEDEMQSIAKELGLSETAFVKQETPSTFSIRYFSPKMEIPLCGHATLASSKIIFDINPDLQQIQFKNINNLILSVSISDDLIEMEFPIYATVPQSAPQALLSALGIQDIINSVYNRETEILLIEIEDSQILERLTPNFEELKSSHDGINGVLITAPSQRNGYDFESRYFWPWSGTNEDPVTGGTHTFLAQYWSDKLNKKTMNSFQCSERSGFMEVEILSNDKMKIRSKAQIILRGQLEIKE